jgi:Helix-turn-helix domain
MRILLANEPRSYREAFADALRVLRPHFEVITLQPDALEEATQRLRPDVVVCSRTNRAIRSATQSWMEIRVEGELLIVRTSDTGRFPAPNPGLESLLEFVDRCEEIRIRRANAS